MRNIVVCADGTGNSFDTNISNVVRLVKSLVLDTAEEQIVFYDQGVGTKRTSAQAAHTFKNEFARPGLTILDEYMNQFRQIFLDGRALPRDPEPMFKGYSVGKWDGDTLVVETIAIDTRMRNISVGRSGDRNAWTHSEQERVIERFSRPSKNFLTYQVTVHDPVVLTQPCVSAPWRWSLAQGPDDVWTEYLCTANEDPALFEKLNQEYKDSYDAGDVGRGAGDGPGQP